MRFFGGEGAPPVDHGLPERTRDFLGLPLLKGSMAAGPPSQNQLILGLELQDRLASRLESAGSLQKERAERFFGCGQNHFGGRMGDESRSWPRPTSYSPRIAFRISANPAKIGPFACSAMSGFPLVRGDKDERVLRIRPPKAASASLHGVEPLRQCVASATTGAQAAQQLGQQTGFFPRFGGPLLGFGLSGRLVGVPGEGRSGGKGRSLARETVAAWRGGKDYEEPSQEVPRP